MPRPRMPAAVAIPEAVMVAATAVGATTVADIANAALLPGAGQGTLAGS